MILYIKCSYETKVDNQWNRYLFLLLIFNVKEISSEIKEEVLCCPHFIFDLPVELEDRINQYEVLPPLCMKITYLNIHFSCSVYTYWITSCCHRTNRGKQQFKHFNRRLNMGWEICYNLHNYLPLWIRHLFLLEKQGMVHIKTLNIEICFQIF